MWEINYRVPFSMRFALIFFYLLAGTAISLTLLPITVKIVCYSVCLLMFIRQLIHQSQPTITRCWHQHQCWFVTDRHGQEYSVSILAHSFVSRAFVILNISLGKTVPFYRRRHTLLLTPKNIGREKMRALRLLLSQPKGN